MSKLIWITPNAEQVITDCARVSNPANQGKDGTGLINFLIHNKHWSPFEMASACFEVTTSKAIAIQMLRHRSFSFQEFSQRYAEVPGVEAFGLRKQAVKNRQSSTDDMEDWYLDQSVSAAMAAALVAYRELVDAGVAKECARMVLPMATTTTLYMAGTIRSWIHYLEQRTSEHAQLEHRLIANDIAAQLADHIPVILDAVGLA
jgi:thymidylate synthase (FAD)